MVPRLKAADLMKALLRSTLAAPEGEIDYEGADEFLFRLPERHRTILFFQVLELLVCIGEDSKDSKVHGLLSAFEGVAKKWSRPDSGLTLKVRNQNDQPKRRDS